MNRSAPRRDRVLVTRTFRIYYGRGHGFSWRTEASADYVLLFILDGRIRHVGPRGEVELGRGEELLLEPGITAAAFPAASSRDSVEYMALSIAPGYVLNCAARAGLAWSGAQIAFRAAVVRRDERLARLGQDLAAEITSQTAGQEMVASAIVEQVVVHLFRHHAIARRIDSLELSRVGLVDRRIRRAVELMHAHIDQDLPLELLAEAAFLSQFHFARLFKKITGTSPHAYLAALRASVAEKLLATTDLSITEVAARVGFSSQSHFTRAFRHATGMTPSGFRKALMPSRD